jgi:chemotaxis protein CheD
MLELNSELREIYLGPGELHITREPAIIRTALGACIGITFCSAKLRVGALAHPLLPNCPTDLTAEKRLVTGRRYVDFSIRQLAWQFDPLDVSRGEVHVKVFGGAEVVGIGAAAKPAIGKMNREAAIEVLEAEGSKIIASSLGGNLATPIPYRDRRGGAAVAWENQSRERYRRVSRTCQVFPIE